MNAIETDARWLGQELLAIGRRGVVAREVGARLPGDDPEGRHIPRVFGVVRVGRGGHERPLLGQELDTHVLELFGVGAYRAREAAVRNAPDETAEAEEQKTGE